MRILPTAVLLSLALAAPAAASIAPPDVPAALQPQPPGANKVFFVGHATGVQIYACDGSAWKFVAPRADLFNDAGKLKITHFGGPTWQAKDGSRAVGTVIASTPPTATAISALLLSMKTTPGPFGDRLVKTTFIQRVNTRGGLAPAAATCTAATAGTPVEVPYTADYYFWHAK